MQSASDPDAEAIVAEIRTAFCDVQRGETTLHETDVIDDWGTEEQCAAARKHDTESHWNQVPDEDIDAYPNTLCFLDPVSWRYYIPAFMIWTLRNCLSSNSLTSDFTISTFDLSDEHASLSELEMERFGMLTDQQSRAVCKFLRYMAGDENRGDCLVANEALRKYWGRFCAGGETTPPESVGTQAPAP